MREEDVGSWSNDCFDMVGLGRWVPVCVIHTLVLDFNCVNWHTSKEKSAFAQNAFIVSS